MQCGNVENRGKTFKKATKKFETHFEVVQFYVHQRWASVSLSIGQSVPFQKPDFRPEVVLEVQSRVFFMESYETLNRTFQ